MIGRFSTKLKIILFLVLASLVIINVRSYFLFEKSIDRLLTKERVIRVDDTSYNHDFRKNGVDNHNISLETTHIEERFRYPFTMVTAASSNHFCAIQSWLYYMKRSMSLIPVLKQPRIVVYDIGLMNYQRKWLKVLFEKKYFTELRTFDFEKYPSFWTIDNITRGEYAWKPGIISEIIEDYPGPIFWLDSGTFVKPVFLEQFNAILDYYNGFFSPRSSGYIPQWTHPGVFKHFNDDMEKYSNTMNCNGAAIAFDSNKVGSLMSDWTQCARIKECIAPEGSNRENHRQDQAILTYLAAKEERFCTNKLSFFGLKTHMDKTCEKNIYFYEKLNNITWSPTVEDLNEIKRLKDDSTTNEHEAYDIWNPGSEENLLNRIEEKDEEIFAYFFSKIQGKL